MPTMRPRFSGRSSRPNDLDMSPKAGRLAIFLQLVNHASDLSDGIIRVVGCLHAFIPADSYTHVSCLDHSNVIGTIPNGEGDGLYSLLNHIHYLRLLQRRHPVREERNDDYMRLSRGNGCNLHLAALKGQLLDNFQIQYIHFMLMCKEAFRKQ